MKNKYVKIYRKMGDVEKWGGLIETMYTQYGEEEIPEKIRKLKSRLDTIDKAENLYFLKKIVLTFTDEERNYLNSSRLDELYVCLRKKKLNTAMRKNHYKIAKYLLENYENEFVNSNFYFLTIESIEKNFINLVKLFYPFLEKYGCNIMMPYYKCQLYKSSIYLGRIEIFEFLMEKSESIITNNLIYTTSAEMQKYLLEKWGVIVQLSLQ